MQQRVKVSDIHIAHDRKRKCIDMKIVETIAASIKEIGLQNPISIYFANDYEIDGEILDNVPILAAGAHRRAALISLGDKYDYIDCVVFEDRTAARKWEISENLHRKELTVDERSEHVNEWLALTEEKIAKEVISGQLVPKLKSDDNPKGAGRPESGIAAASRELGIGEKAAQRAVKIASRTPEAKEACIAAGLDNNQKALLEVANTPSEKQVEKVAEIAARKAAPRPKAQPLKAVTADKALEIIANGVIANPLIAKSVDDEEQEFWRFWASLSIGAKRRIMPQIIALNGTFGK